MSFAYDYDVKKVNPVTTREFISKLSAFSFDQKTFKDFVAEFSFDGMDLDYTAALLYQAWNDKEGKTHLTSVCIWIAKAGGNMKDNKMERWSKTDAMKAAKLFLGIKEKARGEQLSKTDITISRIGAVMHTFIVDLMIKVHDKLKPAANVDFGGLNAKAYTNVACSTFGPYTYDATSDKNGLVKSFHKEWSYQHHNTVNPIPDSVSKGGKMIRQKEREKYNKGIFELKLSSTGVAQSKREDITKTILVALESMAYIPGQVYPDAWAEWNSK